MDDCVIELSSDSSGPDSPKCEKVNDNTPLCEYEETKNGITDIYNPQFGKQSEIRNDDESNNTKSAIVKSFHFENEINNEDREAESDILFDLPPVMFLEKDNIKQKNSLKLHELSDSDDSSDLSQKYSHHREDKTGYTKQTTPLKENDLKKGKKRGRGKNTATDKERERKKAERLEKQACKAREKALKQATNEALRSKKPEECLKYIKVCLDQSLLSCEFGGQILVELQAAGIQYNIQTNSVQNSILWTREILEHTLGEDLKVNIETRVKEEDDIVIVWMWDKVVKCIKNGDFLTQVQVTQSELPGKTISFVVYGSKEYFKYQKNSKRREVRANVFGTEARARTNKKEANFESMPHISEDDWEITITELQLFGFQHVMVDNAVDLAVYIRQFTKAVAEAPYKREKQEQELGDVEWYGEGDSRNCVRVDKNGNGLLRLWQQQLCQFNNVGLETAQAIAAVYGSPSALIRAYENCSSENEARMLLASIPVRRGVGPLTTMRSVGPELSKRIYAFFNCFDVKSVDE